MVPFEAIMPEVGLPLHCRFQVGRERGKSKSQKLKR